MKESFVTGDKKRDLELMAELAEAMANLARLASKEIKVENEKMKESPVRDLARQLAEVARNHVAYSQVADFMNHVNSHLSAIAFAEEVHQGCWISGNFIPQTSEIPMTTFPPSKLKK